MAFAAPPGHCINPMLWYGTTITGTVRTLLHGFPSDHAQDTPFMRGQNHSASIPGYWEVTFWFHSEQHQAIQRFWQNHRTSFTNAQLLHLCYPHKGDQWEWYHHHHHHHHHQRQRHRHHHQSFIHSLGFNTTLVLCLDCWGGKPPQGFHDSNWYWWNWKLYDLLRFVSVIYITPRPLIIWEYDWLVWCL